MVLSKNITLMLIFLLLGILFPSFVGMGLSSQVQYVGPQLLGNEIGPLSPSGQLCIEVFVPPKDMNELYLVAQEVANHQIKPLSNSQLISMFGQQQKVDEIAQALEQEGFQVVYESPFSLIAQAPAGTVERLFSTQLYLFNNSGETYYKPVATPKVPEFLKGVVIGGLTNFTLIRPQHIVVGKVENGALIPTSLQGLPTFQFSALYYTPKDFQGAYNVTGNKPGYNVTVAVVDAYGDPEIYQDLKAFDKMFGLPPINLTVIPVGPYHPIYGILTGWATETALDVEMVHTMAPYAKVDLVVASNNGPALFEAIDLIVSEDLAQVVSMSWGAPENLYSASGFYAVVDGVPIPNYPYLDYYFMLGAAEGISFFAASGDEGAYGGTLTTYGGVIFPSSSPFVTAVGGTSLYVNVTSGYLSSYNSTATYGYETAWSVSPWYAGIGTSTVSSTGGYSTFFPAPWYQIPITHSKFRTTPDVAADANPYTGGVIIVDGQEEVIGGTSMAAPLWSGAIADVDSYLGKSLGLVNPLLYGIYVNKTLYSEAFHPVTFGYNGKYSANSSYNLVTGLGSPNVGGLEEAISYMLSHVKHLDISVSTFEPGVTYPWYIYGSTFTVVAYISTQGGRIVTNGSFNAYIYTLDGFLAEVPLTFNGTYWVGNFTISPGDPPNVWSIVVNGTAYNETGVGAADVDVGESINILTPVGDFLPIDEPITVEACIYYPNGTPVTSQTFTAYFIQNGMSYANVTLLPTTTPGLYKGVTAFLPPTPQGTYILVINNTYGSAYTYDYVGGVIEGLVFTPINDGLPSADPGQNITIFGLAEGSNGLGIFTSNMTAYIYNPDGRLVASVPMVPAPDVPQFGIIDAFLFHEANFTIPSNFTPGFYTVVIEANVPTSVGTEVANFTTSFYVGSSTLTAEVRGVTTAYEGQNLVVTANITYPNGTEVKYGEFSLTLLPSQFSFASLIVEVDTYVPMQYDSKLNEWVGVFIVPSVLNDYTGYSYFYEGANPYELSGPWNLVITGVSAGGHNVYYSTFLNVMPYTYLGNLVVNAKNISAVPLMAFNGTTYFLDNVYVNSLKVSGVGGIVLEDSIVGELDAYNSTVVVENSKVIQVNAVDSNLTFIQDTLGGKNVALSLTSSTAKLISSVIEDSSYAFNISNSVVTQEGVSEVNVVNESTLPEPTVTYVSPVNVTTATSTVTVNITGEKLKVTSVKVDGSPVSYFISTTSGGVSVSVPFNASKLPDGLYTIEVTVSDGLSYTLYANFYNSYHEVVTSGQISSLHGSLISVGTDSYVGIGIASVGLIIGIVALILSLRKR
ncbi:MAG: protease pro-enzyme activation domain-containing protein [Candidatus Aramenus sulfurataquae]|uniref:Protease pro-enzyme activation domain-containing protein n=1 Tax=Candidatus Aramenus sulfurataquae TaxID=1326980 RepID=A0ACC6TRV6_9CREN